MSNSGAIKAGKAYVELYADKEQLAKNLDESKAAVTAFGAIVTSVGANAAAGWGAVALAFRKSAEAASSTVSVIVGAVKSTVRAAGDAVNATGESLKSSGGTIAWFGARLLATGGILKAVFTGALKTFEDMGTAAQRLADRTGVSVESLTTLGYAARQTGASMESLESSMSNMQQVVAGVSASSAEGQRALNLLGITVAQLQGLSPDQQFRMIAERLARVADPAQRAAGALKIFGASAQGILPLIAQGGAGLASLEARARSLGLEMSGKDAQSALSLHNALSTLWETVKMATFAIGAPLADAMKKMVETGTAVVGTISKWIRENGALIVTADMIASVVTGAGTALTIFGGLVSAAGVALTQIVAVVGALLSPIALVTAAVAGLGYYFVKYTAQGQAALKFLSAKFFELRDDVTRAVGGISEALAAGDISLAMEIAANLVKLEWAKAITFLETEWIKWKFVAIDIATQAGEAIAEAWRTAVEKVSSVMESVKTSVLSAWSAIRETVKLAIMDVSQYLDRVGKIVGMFGSLGKSLVPLTPEQQAARDAQDKAGGGGNVFFRGLKKAFGNGPGEGDNALKNLLGVESVEEQEKRIAEAKKEAETNGMGARALGRIKAGFADGMQPASAGPLEAIGAVGRVGANAFGAIRGADYAGLWARIAAAPGAAAGAIGDDLNGRLGNPALAAALAGVNNGVPQAQKDADEAIARARALRQNPKATIRGDAIAADFSGASAAAAAERDRASRGGGTPGLGFEDARTAGGFKSIAAALRQGRDDPQAHTLQKLDMLAGYSKDSTKYLKDIRDAEQNRVVFGF
jgi:hypothetical protein